MATASALSGVSTTPTYNTNYVTGYDKYLQDTATSNPQLYNQISAYGQITDKFGNPLIGQQTLDALTQPNNTKIYNAANTDAYNQKLTWAKDVLANDYIDPITKQPVQWLGGTGKGSQYDTELQNLMNDPRNNVRWQGLTKTIAQQQADADLAAATTKQEAADAAAAKQKADADAAAATAAQEKDLATKVAAEKAAEDTTWANVTKPLDTKTLGGAFDETGKPIVTTAPITQGMIDTAKSNVSTVTPQLNTLYAGQTPTTIATDVNKLVDAAKAVDVNVTPDSLVSNRLSGLLAKNNPYIQNAVNQANLAASRRGMLYTGAAQGFAQDAAIKNAAELAKADAATIAAANQQNAQAQNTLINKGLDIRSQALATDQQAKNTFQNTMLSAKANGMVADAGEINKATNLFQQAILNDLVNGTQSARDLASKVTEGNIVALNNARQGIITQLGKSKEASAAQQLAILNADLEQSIADKKAETDLQLEGFKNNQQDRITFLNFVDSRLKSAESQVAAIMLKEDMSGEGKTAAINNVWDTTYSLIISTGNSMKISKDLINSAAGGIATKLVSP